MNKTLTPSIETIERKWFLFDAKDKTLGRLATEIATVLRGKNKPTFTPHLDTGDFVIVVNAEKVKLSGKKETKKEYFKHTNYPGGAKTSSVKLMRSKKPEFLLMNSVKGMLPHNRLGRRLNTHLKVYSGPKHPHSAQKPKTIEI